MLTTEQRLKELDTIICQQNMSAIRETAILVRDVIECRKSGCLDTDKANGHETEVDKIYAPITEQAAKNKDKFIDMYYKILLQLKKDLEAL